MLNLCSATERDQEHLQGGRVKFLVDAQLPLRLAEHLRSAGHDVLHTSELPLANKTPDHAFLLLAKRMPES